MNICFSFVSILGLALRLRHEFTIVSTLVLQQLALDSLRLRSRANDLFFHNNTLLIKKYYF